MNARAGKLISRWHTGSFERGKALGLAKRVIAVLEARSLPVTDSQRERILACTAREDESQGRLLGQRCVGVVLCYAREGAVSVAVDVKPCRDAKAGGRIHRKLLQPRQVPLTPRPHVARRVRNEHTHRLSSQICPPNRGNSTARSHPCRNQLRSRSILARVPRRCTADARPERPPAIDEVAIHEELPGAFEVQRQCSSA